MEEPNKSALALLQHEASALLALFDQLRGGDAPRCATADDLAGALVRRDEHEHAAGVTN
ncbi:hypothetical protein AB8807_15255 [Xanthomonas campestris pv. olitorii]|uniref:hypothetical protein n=1 Tax=Xanthomonas axonopodis TaxID=53413 RepID=UPI001E40EEDF|nr:hypothetical protein KWH09_15200 [Xanthomonas campestris pv. olitorii]